MIIKELKALIADLPDDMEVFKSDGELFDKYWSERVYHCDYNPRIKRVGEESRGQYAIAKRPCKETKGAKQCLVL